MTEAEIEQALDRAEAAVQGRGGLAGTGFWKAVDAVKRSPALTERYADRIARIDRRAFEGWPLVTVPPGVGIAVMSASTAAGARLISSATKAGRPWNWLLFGFGTGTLLGSTHALTHWIVGRAMGMRFTHWYIASITKPQPGLKVDYATYLRTPARKRAWMHASGALVTKAIPFVLLVPARRLPRWVSRLLVAAGVFQVVTDVVWSTKASDWKKFLREMRYTD